MGGGRSRGREGEAGFHGRRCVECCKTAACILQLFAGSESMGLVELAPNPKVSRHKLEDSKKRDKKCATIDTGIFCFAFFFRQNFCRTIRMKRFEYVSQRFSKDNLNYCIFLNDFCF